MITIHTFIIQPESFVILYSVGHELYKEFIPCNGDGLVGPAGTKGDTVDFVPGIQVVHALYGDVGFQIHVDDEQLDGLVWIHPDSGRTLQIGRVVVRVTGAG